jgi:hypothetical protein
MGEDLAAEALPGAAAIEVFAEGAGPWASRGRQRSGRRRLSSGTSLEEHHIRVFLDALEHDLMAVWRNVKSRTLKSGERLVS